MDTPTQQFAFRWFVRTVCGLIGGMFLYMATIGIMQGDGEAIKIIQSLTPMMQDTLAALVLMVTGAHAGQIVSNIVTSKQTQNASQPAKVAESGQSVGSVA